MRDAVPTARTAMFIWKTFSESACGFRATLANPEAIRPAVSPPYRSLGLAFRRDSGRNTRHSYKAGTAKLPIGILIWRFRTAIGQDPRETKAKILNPAIK